MRPSLSCEQAAYHSSKSARLIIVSVPATPLPSANGSIGPPPRAPHRCLPAAAQYANASHQSTQPTGKLGCAIGSKRPQLALPPGRYVLFQLQKLGWSARLGEVARKAQYAALLTSVASMWKAGCEPYASTATTATGAPAGGHWIGGLPSA